MSTVVKIFPIKRLDEARTASGFAQKFVCGITTEAQAEEHMRKHGATVGYWWKARSRLYYLVAEHKPIVSKVPAYVSNAVEQPDPETGERPEFPYGEFDNGYHWKGRDGREWD